ncbi:MAG TPA: hypothetical protein VNH11_07210 [Pirellulales bacterium]|nr:hypothetical protein [Pirellulales bacterium]
MGEEMIHNRGRGPEILGTRTTVYQLLPYFLDATVTEEYIATLYDLSIEQIAAARAYVLNNADTVLANHMKIEERIAAGNPPEVIEQAKRTRERFLQFKEWLEKRKADREALENAAGPGADKPGGAALPSFQEWLSAHRSPEHS